MKTSDKGLNLIKKYEGFRSKSYKCPAGVWTIGYGTTRVNNMPVSINMTCTEAQATEWLKSDISKAEANVMKYDNKYHWNQNQFDAMVSFAYNVGSIDQLTAKGTRTIAQIGAKIPEYNKGGGKVLAGLVKRRAEEKNLFYSEVQKRVLKYTQPMMYGDDVKIVQKKVEATIDAWFGKKTKQKVIDFQIKNGLVADGIVGEDTWNKILE